MKRNRGRSRRSGGQNPNRHYESTGPDVKIRGSAQQICDKYQQYARDALSAGDRVAAENYLQHAEHYFRIVAAMQPKDKPREETSRDDDDDDGDDDENENDAGEADNASDKRDDEDKPSSRRSPRRSRVRSGDSNTDSDDSSDSADSDDPMKVVADADDTEQPQEIGKDDKSSRAASGDTGEKPKPRRRTYKKKSDADASADDNSGVMSIVSRGASRKSEETEDTPAE